MKIEINTANERLAEQFKSLAEVREWATGNRVATSYDVQRVLDYLIDRLPVPFQTQYIKQPYPNDVLTRCRELGQTLKPYAIISVGSMERECISYPYPNDIGKCIEIKVRKPGDPTTMCTLLVEQYS